MRRERPALSWLLVGALGVLLAVLAFLQYQWLGEVSRAERERLKGSLQISLVRLSQDFNSELTSACRALMPQRLGNDAKAAGAQVAAQYMEWRQSRRYMPVFSSIALAVANRGRVSLLTLAPESGKFEPADWPAAWQPTRDRLEARLAGEPWRDRRPGPPDDNKIVLELPIFADEPGSGGPPREGPRELLPKMGPPGFADFRHGTGPWLVLDVNVEYVREAMLPELLKRYLSSGGETDYQAEVVTRTEPALVIFRSDPGSAGHIGRNADASVGLFELQFDQLFRAGRRGRRPEAGGTPGPGRMFTSMFGRWELLVRHRSGSLDTVVAHARVRNLIVTGGIFLLMLSSVAALVVFTRRAQRLAELQMQFVAGVSHELRTPLTVIHTAAYNLRGRLAANPAQVERYGALIQRESGRLKDLVEQVLRFAGSSAKNPLQQPESIPVEAVIDEAIEAAREQIEGVTIEKKVEAGVPAILGDRVALKHALGNLVSNAAKYGANGTKWIGVFASRAGENGREVVEIRVMDRGPGIPEDEQRLIFDPFYRGRRAVQDQVHGTGLGLSLVKNIVEGHGGSIRLKSAPGEGAEFTISIPAAPPSQQAKT